MRGNRLTKFNGLWLKDPLFESWIAEAPDKTGKALCKLCRADFELGNMGKQALVSHDKGKKHQKRASQLEKVKTETKSITEFCKGLTAFSEKQKDTSDGSSGTERFENSEPQQETMSQPATVQGSSSGIKSC